MELVSLFHYFSRNYKWCSVKSCLDNSDLTQQDEDVFGSESIVPKILFIRSKGLASHPGCYTDEEKVTGTYWIGEWLGQQVA
jgi:hypothetical protein